MCRRDRPRRWLTLLGSFLAVLILTAPAIASNPYPDPPPQFPVLDEPHDVLLNPIGGTTDRPMVVIYVQFADERFEDTNSPPGDKWTDTDFMDASDIHERFFSGEFPSVVDYFETSSNGNLIFFPADESDDSNGGAINDGVISITIDANKTGWVFGDDALEWHEQQEAILNAASEHIDFASFDRNGDGRVTEDELIIVRHDVDLQEIPGGSGAIRSAPSGLEIDGVTLGRPGQGFRMINSGTATNLMTLVHEIGHQAFDMLDTYAQGAENIGSAMDIGGFTSNVADDDLFHPNAWHAMHLGWIDPVVVTKSGFYDVPRVPYGSSFILYDPEKDTDNYFIVENRGAIAGTYDQGVGGHGLVVWRIDESVYSPDAKTDFMTLIAPEGTAQAWAPNYDHNHSHRTIEGVDWRDGTSNDLAIRAISPASDSIRVYFDVRGPGLLIDPLTDALGNPFVSNVLPGEISVPFSVPVMNTGEETDTFSFTFEDLPSAWASGTQPLTLDAGETDRAEPEIIPALDAATGHHDVTLVGTSSDGTTVREQITLTVNVVLEPSSISYTGETYVPIDHPAGFAAHVTMQSDGSPVVGADVTFELSNDDGVQLSAVGTTGMDGIATADPIIGLPPGNYTLSFAADRLGKHAPASGTTSYRIPTVTERIQDLIDDIIEADLNQGIENSFVSQLEQSLEHVEAEREIPACNTLNAFGNHAEAQADIHLPQDLADAILPDLAGIQSQYGCGS
jgi:M6 family metalloprotease-like protein